MSTHRRSSAAQAAAAHLSAILDEMAERGIRPDRLKVIARATDRGCDSATVAAIGRLARQQLEAQR